MGDYNMNEFDILDYTKVKSINIKQLLPLFFLFTCPDMYEGSFQEPQPQIRFFVENLFMKLGFPEKIRLSRKGFFTRNPKWFLKGSSRRTL